MDLGWAPSSVLGQYGGLRQVASSPSLHFLLYHGDENDLPLTLGERVTQCMRKFLVVQAQKSAQKCLLLLLLLLIFTVLLLLILLLFSSFRHDPKARVEKSEQDFLMVHVSMFFFFIIMMVHNPSLLFCLFYTRQHFTTKSGCCFSNGSHTLNASSSTFYFICNLKPMVP